MNLMELQRCRDECSQAVRDFLSRRGCSPDRVDALAERTFLNLLDDMRIKPWCESLADVFVYRAALDLLRRDGPWPPRVRPATRRLTTSDRTFQRARRVLHPIDLDIATLHVWEGLPAKAIGFILDLDTKWVERRLGGSISLYLKGLRRRPPGDDALGAPVPARPKAPMHPALRGYAELVD